MKPLLLVSFLIILGLTGCIGAGTHNQFGDRPTPFGQKLIGLTHDQMVLKYGPPDRTAKLDNGKKLAYYRISSRGLNFNGRRIHDDCILSVAFLNKRVIAAGFDGDRSECERYIDSGTEKNAYYNFKR